MTNAEREILLRWVDESERARAHLRAAAPPAADPDRKQLQGGRIEESPGAPTHPFRPVSRGGQALSRRGNPRRGGGPSVE
jgi:hypothetical protein